MGRGGGEVMRCSYVQLVEASEVHFAPRSLQALSSGRGLFQASTSPSVRVPSSRCPGFAEFWGLKIEEV